MKPKAIKKKWKPLAIIVFASLCVGGFESCSENDQNITPPALYPSNPNQPVVFNEFTPNKGGVRTRMFITGSNFGTDPSLINVNIGGKDAKIIKSDGKMIYCLVPARADGGSVEVEIKNTNGKESTKYTFEEKFTYEYHTVVSTLCGVVDKNGNAASTDGGFDVAGFNDPWQMSLYNSDGEKCIYLFDGYGAPGQRIRKIDLNKQEVSTPITGANVNWQYSCNIQWSNEQDTLFVNNVDDTSEDATAMFYFLKSENFSIGYPGAKAKGANLIVRNPANKSFILPRSSDGLIKQCAYDPQKEEWNTWELSVRYSNINTWTQNAVFHPEGKYLYFICRNWNSILKSYYNAIDGTISQPTVFVGATDGSGGYNDGVGTEARFSTPLQGCFVKNDDYVREGKEDVYDFYVSDFSNHCIRKITPDGIVTTFAGRGSWSTDGTVHGYIDGDPRTEARFNMPHGICYDESTATFYIGDAGNHRIRTIAVQ